MAQKRKLAAILSADVVGYSRLMAANEAATLETLKAYREIIARLVVRHGGRVVNAPGDALLAEFPSAVEAVQAAVEIQKVLAELGWVFRFDETPVAPQEITAQAAKAVQLDPADARARMVLACAYFWTKQLDLFEHEAKQAIALAPYDAEILATLGSLMAQMGQWQRGVALVNEANALNADAAIGWYHVTLYLYYYLKGDYQRSLEFRRLHPDQQAIYSYIEYIPVYGQLGRKQEALENWRKLLKEEPGWTAESFKNYYRLWNMRDEDAAKLMDGVYKSGVLAAEAKSGQ
jgi:tetratricopeptide (TPR) repeat protein